MMESSNEEKIRIADQLIGRKELTGSYKKGTDEWVYEFPTPLQRAEIERQIAEAVGVPIEHFNKNEYLTVRVCVYLDAILTKSPEWWTSAADCRDEELTFAIFEKFTKDQNNFRRRLRERKFPRVSGSNKSS